jgi:hypothetical protein
MAKRQREWAKRARLALIAELGGVCVDCAATTELELDHIKPCTYDRSKTDPSWRVSIYRREAKEGKITVRCKRCNISKQDSIVGQPRFAPAANGTGEQPF